MPRNIVLHRRPIVPGARAAADNARTREHARRTTPAQRREAVRRYQRGEGTLREIAHGYGMSAAWLSQLVSAAHAAATDGKLEWPE